LPVKWACLRARSIVISTARKRFTELALAPLDDPLLATLTFEQQLEWLARRLLSIVETNREFFVTFAAERASMDWELAGEKDVAGSAYEHWVAAFCEVLVQGVADGALRPLDTWNAAYLVSGALNATIFRWIRGQLPVALQDYVPILLDMILSGLRAEPQP